MKISKLSQFIKKRWRVFLSLFVLTASIYWSAALIFGQSKKTPPQPLFVIGDERQSELSSNLRFSLTPLPNFTNEFTDRAIETLLVKNEPLKAAGIVNLKNYSLLPEKNDVAEIISKIIDQELAAEQIAMSDLLINQSNSKETQIAYLLLINEIIETKSKEMPVLGYYPLTVYFSDTAVKLDEIAQILLMVNVPPAWLEIHHDLVSFFLRQRNIYRSLGAADVDPLRFMIASTRLLPAETEKEFQNIQTKINQKIINEKLIF